MPVGILIDNILYNMGPADLIHAVFSTIAAHLETDNWGVRFPHLLGELYAGELRSENADAALAEIRLIKKELRTVPPEYAIWAIEDPSQYIPSGSQLWRQAPNLAEFFRDHVDDNLLDKLEQYIEILKRKGGTARLLNVK